MRANLYRPAAFQGAGRTHGPYFEGWYFKLVDAAGAAPVAVIPGLFLDPGGSGSHAFIQTLDSSTGRTTYHRYPLDAFHIAPRDFHLTIGRSFFSLGEIALDLHGEGEPWAGRVRFHGVQGWPVSWRSPGIMDWYGFVPFMECYHGVLGFDHALEGQLVVAGRAVDFTGGRGYIEKDWGEAFPRAWVWMQTNHFGAPGVCLTASVARIPWLGAAFRGCIVGLWLDGALYRFATYTGAAIERLEVDKRAVHWTLAGRGPREAGGQPLRLEITAWRPGDAVGLLHAPHRTAMLQRVMENLTARIHVRLSETAGGRVIFEGEGAHAGLELGGNLEEIL